MVSDPVLSGKREDVLRIARRHGVGRVRVFGSAARGELRPDSDIDLLVDVDGPTTPWFPGGLLAELEALLQRRVQVVETSALREELRASVLAGAIPL